MAAKARLQINFMISTVDDIKQVAGLPEVVYPLFWFESVSYTSDYSESNSYCQILTFLLISFFLTRTQLFKKKKKNHTRLT